MTILLDTYKELVKEAEDAVVKERVDFLDKYAAFATEELQKEFPNNFTQDDVVDLAGRLIDNDLAVEAEQEKQAEAVNIVAEYIKVAEAALADEYGKNYTSADVELLADRLMEKDAEAAFDEDAQEIIKNAFLTELESVLDMEKMSGKVKDFFVDPKVLEETTKVLQAKYKDASNAVQAFMKSVPNMIRSQYSQAKTDIQMLPQSVKELGGKQRKHYADIITSPIGDVPTESERVMAGNAWIRSKNLKSSAIRGIRDVAVGAGAAGAVGYGLHRGAKAVYGDK
jgi:hypothetical protein